MATEMGLHCAWCRKVIGLRDECFAAGLKKAPGVDLGAREGQTLEMTLSACGRTVEVIVTKANSPARKKGYDMVAMTCSARCGAELRAALIAEGVVPAADASDR